MSSDSCSNSSDSDSPANLQQNKKQKRKPRVFATSEQCDGLMAYLREHFSMLYRKLIPGRFDMDDRNEEWKKFFNYARTELNFKIESPMKLRKRITSWKTKATEIFNDPKNGTGGGPPKKLTPVQEEIIDILCDNGVLARGANRV